MFLIVEIQDGIAFLIYAYELATNQKGNILSDKDNILWYTISSTLVENRGLKFHNALVSYRKWLIISKTYFQRYLIQPLLYTHSKNKSATAIVFAPQGRLGVRIPAATDSHKNR